MQKCSPVCGFLRLAARGLPLIAALAFTPFLSAQEAASAKIPKLRAAASQGDAYAEDELASIYAGRLDLTNAILWYRKAAARGVANSQWNLGRLLLDQAFDARGKLLRLAQGNEAIQWYLKAAHQGARPAQFELARFYETGKVVEQNSPEAFRWYTLAQRGGGREIAAQGSLEHLAARMSPEQMEEARRLIAEYLAAHSVPPPSTAAAQLILKNISANPQHPQAVINDHLFSVGEEMRLQLGDEFLKIRCLKILERSVLVKIEGVPAPVELKLALPAR